jgi:transcriptional regulator
MGNEDATLALVEEMVRVYEAGRASPWRLEAGSLFSRNMVKAVVGFEIEITRMEGKWKLNQNHSEERREKVIRALRGTGDAAALGVADMMAEAIGERP